MILVNGGIVRNLDNLGDRVLVKSLRAQDGQRYSLGRFLQVQFDANPEVLRRVEDKAREDPEVLRVNTNKLKDREYLDKSMKRLNQELSPFRDSVTYDENYVRSMWTIYSNLTTLRKGSTAKEIAKDLPQVAALVKRMETGKDHPDAQTLEQWNQG